MLCYLSIIRDSGATSSSKEEFLERTLQLVADGVGIVGTAASDYLPDDVYANAFTILLLFLIK